MQEGRYSLSLMKTDRANGVHHVSYRDNPKTHPLIKYVRSAASKKMLTNLYASHAARSYAHSSFSSSQPRVFRFENQVLEYKAVYEEKVRTEDGSHVEPHDCMVRFFVEDGTMEVMEKPVANSGRTEFRLIKRNVIYKPGQPSVPYTAADLFSGSRLVAYGMAFLILHGTSLAEAYTAAKFGGARIETARPGTGATQGTRFIEEAMRTGGFGNTTGGFSDTTGGARPGTTGLVNTRKEREAAFLTQQDFAAQIDNVCLDLVWDDTQSLYGDMHELKLKYYLLDDTADVYCVESKKFETKYSPGTAGIVRRQKLQKDTEMSAPLQGLDSRMRLATSPGGRHQAPKLQFVDCNAPGVFYHWSELIPGAVVSVLGRKATVVGFGNARTERFYAQQMGAGLVAELKDKFRIDTTREVPLYAHAIPEHVGIGSYEDSLRSVKAIAPEAPPSRSGDYFALRFKLQFKAKLLSATKSDQARVFIVSFFCEDSTLMIFESSPRNSGRASYTFAKKQKYVKAFDITKGNEPIYYGPLDIGVGAILVVNGHHFEMTEAAPGSSTFMTAHPEHFS